MTLSRTVFGFPARLLSPAMLSLDEEIRFVATELTRLERKQSEAVRRSTTPTLRYVIRPQFG